MKAEVKKTPYWVVRDTKEKSGHGWTFKSGGDCLGTEVSHLKTGDYTLKGLEHHFVIERKGSSAEFCANLTQKEKWDDFRHELERMEAIAHPYIILEFSVEHILSYPKGSGIPQYLWRKIRISPDFYLKRFLQIQNDYKVKVVTAGAFGREVAVGLFKEFSKCL